MSFYAPWLAVMLFGAVLVFIAGFISYRLIVKSDFGPDFQWDIPLLLLAFVLGAVGSGVLLDSLFDFVQNLDDAPCPLSVFHPSAPKAYAWAYDTGDPLVGKEPK